MPGDEVTALSPASDPTALTLGDAVRIIRAYGSDDFVPDFDNRFGQLVNAVAAAGKAMEADADKILLKNININTLISSKTS